MYKFFTRSLLAVFLLTSFLFGSGFSIYEQNARATAMAGAFVAQANDAGAVFYNPAGLSTLHGFHLLLGTTAIATDFAFTGPADIDNNLYNEAKKGLFFPSHFYASYRFDRKLSLGFGLFAPFGLTSQWGDDQHPWIGRTLTTRTSLQAIYYNPVVSYRLFDHLSLAAGLALVQSHVELDKDLYFVPRNLYGKSQLKADATGWAFNLAFLYRPIQRLSIGIHYRSTVKLKFKDGEATFSFPVADDTTINREVNTYFPSKTRGSSELTLPSMLSLGLAYHYSENLTFELDYLLTAWHVYDKLAIHFQDPVAGQNEVVSLRNYEDSYSIRFGLEYKVTPSFATRFGYAWDRHAVPNAYVEPSLPEGNRHNYTMGLGYAWHHLTVDTAIHILLQDDREITRSAQNFNGKYSGLATIYSLSIGYSF